MKRTVPVAPDAQSVYKKKRINFDETVKSRNSHFFVIPAQAGIQSFQ